MELITFRKPHILSTISYKSVILRNRIIQRVERIIIDALSVLRGFMLSQDDMKLAEARIRNFFSVAVSKHKTSTFDEIKNTRSIFK